MSVPETLVRFHQLQCNVIIMLKECIMKILALTTNISGGPLVYYDKSHEQNYLIGDTNTSTAQHSTSIKSEHFGTPLFDASMTFVKATMFWVAAEVGLSNY